LTASSILCGFLAVILQREPKEYFWKFRYKRAPSLLGYYAHCSFAPISTIICWIIAGVIYWLAKKKEKINNARLIKEMRKWGKR
jgi:hypothetical protein